MTNDRNFCFRMRGGGGPVGRETNRGASEHILDEAYTTLPFLYCRFYSLDPLHSPPTAIMVYAGDREELVNLQRRGRDPQ